MTPDALLQSLWQVAEGFADQAWGMRPERLIACGQVEENPSNAALTAPFGVECLDRIIANEFKNAAGASDVARREEDTHEADEN